MQNQHKISIAVHSFNFVETILKMVFAFIKWLIGSVADTDEKVSFIFTTASNGGMTVEGDIKMVTLQQGEQVTLSATPKTSAGKSASIEKGTASWTSSDESAVSVTPNPENELQAVAKRVNDDADTSVTIELRADGAKGEDVREIFGVATIVAPLPDAEVFEISAGTPSQQETSGGSEGESETPVS